MTDLRTEVRAGVADAIRAVVPPKAVDGAGKPVESGEPVTRKVWDISAKLRNGALGAALVGVMTEVTGFDRVLIWGWNGAVGSWSGWFMPDEIATTVITIIAYFAAGWLTRDNAPAAGPKPAT